MKIIITQGTGNGKTGLAAFDAALFDAGIANYNLIKLSSVIPAGTDIQVEKITKYNSDEYGYKLYVVLAEKIVSEPGKEAVAGIGWVKHGLGKESGLFVEFGADSEEEIRKDITETLTSMCSYRPEEAGAIQMVISKVKCVDVPVCALVSAVYKSEGWE